MTARPAIGRSPGPWGAPERPGEGFARRPLREPTAFDRG
jgi:hypothetical protein